MKNKKRLDSGDFQLIAKSLTEKHNPTVDLKPKSVTYRIKTETN